MQKLFVPKSRASGAGRSLENEQGIWPPEGEWKAALLALAETDPALRLVWQRLGDPPSWRRPSGFETLTRIILEQQVSLRSAESTFHKLQQLLDGPLTPRGIVQLSADQTRACGVSRQKHRYLNQLADDIVNGRFALDRLSEMTNREALAQLTARLGIGCWSAEVYLMSALNRPDILPLVIWDCSRELRNWTAAGTTTLRLLSGERTGGDPTARWRRDWFGLCTWIIADF